MQIEQKTWKPHRRYWEDYDHRKTYKIPLVNRKTQIKNYYTPTKLVKIKNITSRQLERPCWQECKMVQLFWKIIWQFLIKLNMHVHYDPTIPLLRIYQDDEQNKTPPLIATKY